MSRSDNVVRAGLTPKYKDVDTLCQMLDYEPKTPKEAKFQSKCTSHESAALYNPPVKDFAVSKIVVSLVQVLHIPFNVELNTN